MKVTYSSPLFISTEGQHFDQVYRGSILERIESGFLWWKKDVTTKRNIIAIWNRLYMFEDNAEYIPTEAEKVISVYNFQSGKDKQL